MPRVRIRIRIRIRVSISFPFPAYIRSAKRRRSRRGGVHAEAARIMEFDAHDMHEPRGHSFSEKTMEKRLPNNHGHMEECDVHSVAHLRWNDDAVGAALSVRGASIRSCSMWR